MNIQGIISHKHVVHDNIVGGRLIWFPLVVIASNYCPSVASDQNTDPKVAGLNPFMTIPGQESCKQVSTYYKHVADKSINLEVVILIPEITWWDLSGPNLRGV